MENFLLQKLQAEYFSETICQDIQRSSGAVVLPFQQDPTCSEGHKRRRVLTIKDKEVLRSIAFPIEPRPISARQGLNLGCVVINLIVNDE